MEFQFLEKSDVCSVVITFFPLSYRLLEEMLEYLDKVGNKANEEEDAASLKYWKVQHQKGGEILNKVSSFR